MARGLWYKMAALLSSNVYQLLSKYLTDHTFFVIYGDLISSTRPVTGRVPQGCVLGSLLYALFTADFQ